MSEVEFWFGASFWLIAVPVLVHGLYTRWSTRDTLLRVLTLITVTIIIGWHAGAFVQTYVEPSIEIIPGRLNTIQELISIAMGLLVATYGFQAPRSVGMGVVGLFIMIGHSRKMLGSECYYTC